MLEKIGFIVVGALLGAAAASGIASGNLEALQGVILTVETLPLLYPYLIGGGIVGGIVGFLLSFIPPVLSR